MAVNEGSDELVRVKIWDGPVRFVHWALVVAVGFSWWTAENSEMEWHRYSGYTILALLLFRLYWGFAGGGTARFKSFVRGPGAAFGYVRNLFSSNHQITPGHNPLGGWSVVLLLTIMLLQVGTGLFAVDIDGLESGPLADRVEFDTGRVFSEFHDITFTLLQALVAIHILAVLFYLIIKRENLVSAMVGGYKRMRASELPEILFASPSRIVVGVVIAAAIAYAVSKGFHF